MISKRSNEVIYPDDSYNLPNLCSGEFRKLPRFRPKHLRGAKSSKSLFHLFQGDFLRSKKKSQKSQKKSQKSQKKAQKLQKS